MKEKKNLKNLKLNKKRISKTHDFAGGKEVETKHLFKCHTRAETLDYCNS